MPEVRKVDAAVHESEAIGRAHQRITPTLQYVPLDDNHARHSGEHASPCNCHLRIERMKKDSRACHWPPWLQTIGSCNLNVRFTITRRKKKSPWQKNRSARPQTPRQQQKASSEIAAR